ncbi:PepSY domain-containing protein [Paenalcaligenes sp. Me131]|uniref:PepSY domain-containing protein n=1 Tax=Paenalcaligenes sp. Me131 TaxID=3392636 RepID=UPI003D2E6432
MSKKVAALVVAGSVGLAMMAGPADASRSDHERARRAVEAGEIMPLRSLLDTVENDYPGQVVEVELEHEDGQLVYEIKVLQASGQRLKLVLDARTGEVLKVKSK